MRVGDVALAALDLEPDIDRTAPADLHHVAQPVDAGGFADEAQVRRLPGLLHIFDESARPVERGPFLVPGDDEADRACVRLDIRGGCDHRGDRAFHVDRAAPVEQVSAHFRLECIAVPAIARRDDIKVPGKGDLPRSFGTAADGEQVLDRCFGRALLAFSARKAVNLEAQRFEHGLHRVEHLTSGGCHAGRGHQPLRIVQRIAHAPSSCGKGPGAIALSSNCAILSPACVTRRSATGIASAMASCDKAVRSGKLPSHGLQS